jgi:hypothetical protein
VGPKEVALEGIVSSVNIETLETVVGGRTTQDGGAVGVDRLCWHQ